MHHTGIRFFLPVPLTIALASYAQGDIYDRHLADGPTTCTITTVKGVSSKDDIIDKRIQIRR